MGMKKMPDPAGSRSLCGMCREARHRADARNYVRPRLQKAYWCEGLQRPGPAQVRYSQAMTDTAPTTPTAERVDPSRCPLCGQPNQCAMELARASGQPATAPCWCTQISFSPSLLAQVPPAAQKRACICASCAATHPSR